MSPFTSAGTSSSSRSARAARARPLRISGVAAESALRRASSKSRFASSPATSQMSMSAAMR
jgi:hypothetical protein